jgi:hypothetical protein
VRISDRVAIARTRRSTVRKLIAVVIERRRRLLRVRLRNVVCSA